MCTDILAHSGLYTQAFYRLFRSNDELLLSATEPSVEVIAEMKD